MSTATLEIAKAPVDVDQLDTAKPLEVIFAPYQTTLEKWESKVASLVVTDISQKTEMQQARLARLELKEARCTLEKTRKGLVEGLKARTGKIDSAARTIREKMEELEEKLKDSEEFAERHAAKVKAELKASREAELLPHLDGSAILIDLSSLSEEAWLKTLNDTKLLKQARIDAAAKAEAERKAKEEADRIERERIAAENARLKAEAEEAARLAEIERKRIEAEREAERQEAAKKAALLAEVARKEREAAEAERKRLEAEAKAAAEKARKEREVAEAKARAEREAIEAKARAEREAMEREAAKLRAEIEAKAKADAERRAKELAVAKAERERLDAELKAAEEARKAAAAAPDAAKLKAYAEAIRAVPVPELANAAIGTTLADQSNKFAVWIEAQIPKLTT
jgi:colicin import membrane protein